VLTDTGGTWPELYSSTTRGPKCASAAVPFFVIAVRCAGWTVCYHSKTMPLTEAQYGKLIDALIQVDEPEPHSLPARIE
jgi:hypothetical protein